MNIQRAITLANLAFIALGAYFAADLFYHIWGLGQQAIETSAPIEATKARSNSALQRPYSAYRAIIRRDLFKVGKIDPVQPPPQEISDKQLAPTVLKLKLWGTVTGDEEQSYAVIENTQKREQNLYRVGDTIETATVRKILRNKVVLLNNGRNEELAMEQIQQSSRPSARRGSSRRIAPETGGVRTQRISLRRNMINDAMQDVSKLMTEIKITPHAGNDGQPDGLSVSNIKPNSIFRRMGLRNGDILKSVDGQDIQSVDDALKLYESMKSADRVSVQIQRRGRNRNLDYNIRK